MVDFQSRDRTRGSEDEPTDEGEEGEPNEETAEAVEQEYDAETLPYAVVSVGDDRTVETDHSGDAVVGAIEQAGDAVATREVVSAAYDNVQSTLSALVERRDVEAVVTVGGTGVEPSDVTVDAAADLFDKELPGFGELFRVLSHDHDGTAVIRTRATAGIVDGVPVFCLPGETAATRRGVEQIVIEEAEPLAEAATPDE